MIGTLSKGYRQRVVLADALFARARLLILDEPTIGLDPKQKWWLLCQALIQSWPHLADFDSDRGQWSVHRE